MTLITREQVQDAIDRLQSETRKVLEAQAAVDGAQGETIATLADQVSRVLKILNAETELLVQLSVQGAELQDRVEALEQGSGS